MLHRWSDPFSEDVFFRHFGFCILGAMVVCAVTLVPQLIRRNKLQFEYAQLMQSGRDRSARGGVDSIIDRLGPAGQVVATDNCIQIRNGSPDRWVEMLADIPIEVPVVAADITLGDGIYTLTLRLSSANAD